MKIIINKRFLSSIKHEHEERENIKFIFVYKLIHMFQRIRNKLTR